MSSIPGYEQEQVVPRRRGPLARLKALSARQVAAGGERGWWRWLVPGLVVVVVLFAAMDVRRASERAESSLDAGLAAQDLAAAVDQITAVEESLPATGRADARALTELEAGRLEVRSALARLRTDSPSDPDLGELTDRSLAADRAIAGLSADAGSSARRARADVDVALAHLQSLADSVGSRYASDGREAEAEVRRRLMWTLLGGALLLGLLMWTFWAKRSAADAERHERRFRALLANSSDLVMVVDPDDLTVRYATPVVQRMLATPASSVEGASLLEISHADDRERVERVVRAATNGDDAGDTGHWRARHAGGGWIDVEAQCLDLTDDPSVRGIIVTIRDVGERKHLEERLRHQAFHDPLTGLPNRALFEDRVRHAVARARRHGRGLAVLFVDLDDFKTVNDSLGHAAGDDLLRKVAERLDDCIRSSDTVARLGGDEFAVLVEDPDGIDKAEEVAGRVHDALDDPFDILGNEIFVHTSIGIALADEGASSEEMLRNADIAMYAAKSAGKSRSEVFRPTMHMEARKRLQLSGDLRRALENGGLRVHYQPLVDLDSERVKGVEALCRWEHPELGDVPPQDFIPIAEETGLIVQLGRWILGEACKQVREWQLSRPDFEPIYVSVNVSARQFRQPGTVVEQVQEATRESGIDPSLLVLEITESVLMQDRKAVSRELGQLQALGVRVAIDDFGTGYSALSYLREFPIDMVKMDQSFVNDLSRGAGDAALVRSVVELGEALDMQIVAEGIERRDQLDSLSGLQCDMGQGYYFARPLDVAAMGELLSAEAPRSDAPA